jgi:hypothetical protein
VKPQYLHIFLLFLAINAFSQSDTINHKKNKTKIVLQKDTSNILFGGTRIADKDDTTEYHHIVIGAYVSSYGSYYSDETNNGSFVQFPTMAARRNTFGINLAQVSMAYRSSRVRSNVTLHYGDIPASTWDGTYNMIQEAHAGVRLIKRIWLDAGFFKTHIGLESIQPRENVTSSMAVLTYYEPYYLSGAKLTFELSKKFTVQLNAFNGYQGFIDNNSNKAVGLSMLYDVNDNISITYNFLTTDETPDNVSTKHQRYFNNIYATIKANRFSLGLEANYAWQKNSLLIDTTKSAVMTSGLIVARYQLFKKLAAYGRGEYFSDPNHFLTGTLNIGQNIYGGTFGLEYHPLKNASLSAEGRLLQSSNLIFKQGAYYTNQRYEFILCMDVWF